MTVKSSAGGSSLAEGFLYRFHPGGGTSTVYFEQFLIPDNLVGL